MDVDRNAITRSGPIFLDSALARGGVNISAALASAWTKREQSVFSSSSRSVPLRKKRVFQRLISEEAVGTQESEHGPALFLPRCPSPLASVLRPSLSPPFSRRSIPLFASADVSFVPASSLLRRGESPPDVPSSGSQPRRLASRNLSLAHGNRPVEARRGGRPPRVTCRPTR